MTRPAAARIRENLAKAYQACPALWRLHPLTWRCFLRGTGGRTLSNSRVGDYEYPVGTAGLPHAPHTVAGQALSYDLNGNMVAGFDGKAITYDGQNRPTAVTYGGVRT